MNRCGVFTFGDIEVDRQPEEYRLIDRAEVQKILGIGKSTVFRMVNDGRLPQPIRIGSNCIRWRVKDVLAAIEKLETATAA